MTPPAPTGREAPRPSVADAKLALIAWGEDSDARLAQMRASASTMATKLALGAGVAALTALLVRQLRPSGRKQATAATAPAGIDATTKGVKQSERRPRSLARQIGWFLAARAGRWLVSNAIRGSFGMAHRGDDR